MDNDFFKSLILTMKFLLAFILTALLSFVACLFLPWWIIAVVAFVVAVAIPQQWIKSFFAGFLALFVLWAVQSFIIDARNEHVLTTKVASILPLRGSYILLIVVTGIIGGLVSGFAALTGSFLRPANSREKVVDSIRPS
jgi:hypothetical protein